MFKKIIISIVVVLFMLTGVSFADQHINRDRNQYMGHKEWKAQQKQKRRDYRNKERGLDHYGQGYRYQHRGHRQHRPNHYRGHWRSWREWDSHRRHNRHMYNRGHYYRHGGSLYFQFNTPDGTFAFSIGR